MKICPACDRTYTDGHQNFCLHDGATLIASTDDAPPTLLMNQARTTQTNWENYETSPPWQNQPLQPKQTAPFQQNQSFHPAQYQTPNQTLPIVSLVLGISAIVLFCCYGGIPLGAAAIVTGYLGLKNANENPQQNGGRGLAIAGIILGAIGLLFSIGIFLVAILANL